MQQNMPFNLREVFKLTSLGLNPDLFKFGLVTFESQKYICVKDQAVSTFPPPLHFTLISPRHVLIYLYLGRFHHQHPEPVPDGEEAHEGRGSTHA